MHTSYRVPQKPHLLKVIPPIRQSIVVKGDEIVWNNPWHFHPEVELIYCIKGRGTNFIGNSISAIEEGELLLIGKNLPHTRQRDSDFYQRNPGEVPESIVLQFREEFLGKDFFSIDEFRPVAALLARALRGLKFNGSAHPKVLEKLFALRSCEPADAVIELLSLLNILSRSQDFVYLNPLPYATEVSEEVTHKINQVYRYTIDNFREQISLKDVTALTHHSVSAFCRYFKTHTRKSYFHYLSEVRIAYACKLLMEGNLDISEVCYASGFNNFSNFHKQFRKIVQLSPGEYRKQGKNKIPGGGKRH